ncbi:MAG: hypothetical protein GYA31_03040 [Parcubacteria group bacterium]|nr:hypothetical protein [Parcubacteria group bacterium]
MKEKKKTLRQWSEEELGQLCKEMETKPVPDIVQEMQTNNFWIKTIWFLEWVSAPKQYYFIKKMNKIICKRKIKIDLLSKLKEFALKNKVRIVIPD